MQNILIKYQDIVMTDKNKETEFFIFKVNKENFFPWVEEIEFEVLELTLAYEEQRQQQTKNKLITQIAAMKIELYCQWSNFKLELKEQLFKNNQNWINTFNLYHGNQQRLIVLEERKTSKFFKFKSKIVSIFTFGCYNFAAKLINKIEYQKFILQNQKQELAKIELKICNIKEKLNKIEVEITKKRQQLAAFEEEFSIVSNEINSINVDNNKVIPENDRLMLQL